MKEQTVERLPLLFSLLGQLLEERNADDEKLLKMTELCHLLKEDVQLGERTTQVVADIGELGQEALELEANEQEAFIQANEEHLTEYYAHLKQVIEQ
ncbi:hypothetical protein [Priestia abyssalis]|uniref:hypothetical protein n=1 Tax=Priestia abyssalis TaxID=1221450 RepID=UPI000995D018|nr:hypothetical protein [Priestia abyssalis]